MSTDKISDYFEGVAAKYLSAVDADPKRSRQHEIGGLPAAGFKNYLGTPSKSEEYRFKAKQLYFSDESSTPEIIEGVVTWYDCRRNKPQRRPEYRLYYYGNSVTEKLQEGDFFLVAKMRDNSLLMIFAPPDTTIESQLRVLFGLKKIGESFTKGQLNVVELMLPLRLVLEELGVSLGQDFRQDDDIWLESLIRLFGGSTFPTTALFSDYARTSLSKDTDVLDAPDQTIVAWMEHEERLFRIYERYLVQQRLEKGFGGNGDDVESFIGFSLSVQNRRKSRVGHAFEGHLDKIFKAHGLRFQQGRGKDAVTENNAKPDFLFPGFKEYHSEIFRSEDLIMLGAKTTCKDRWRQVLTEANRIPVKHLITLEAAISQKQTNEMEYHSLQLVVPLRIQDTYTDFQRNRLMSLSGFIEFVKSKSDR
ncbi:type II restriction endonuclease [Pseudomonas syringae]|uniref:type II restriction endonuclease n=1 Tax=Pseudomonas syringae TaxID=317 RepID=UPI0006CB01D4|nr:type II restriction endonuclease [Pseudomonas syringae]ALD97295.1 type II restriction endonuclease [Pseudomonas syringae UMAF0158]MCK9730203.1 restriction endonuclease [Pseudomonas syringae pv. syringae]